MSTKTAVGWATPGSVIPTTPSADESALHDLVKDISTDVLVAEKDLIGAELDARTFMNPLQRLMSKRYVRYAQLVHEIILREGVRPSDKLRVAMKMPSDCGRTWDDPSLSYDYETTEIHWLKRRLKDVKFVIMQEQFLFPRSKKKRIQKKWAKNPRNFRPCKDKPKYYWFQQDFHRMDPPRILATPLPEGKLENSPYRYLPFVNDVGDVGQMRVKQDGALHKSLSRLIYGPDGEYKRPVTLSKDKPLMKWIDPRMNVLQTVHDEIDIQMPSVKVEFTIPDLRERMRRKIAIGLGISPAMLDEAHTNGIETPAGLRRYFPETITPDVKSEE